ncbi:MAG: histidine kinase [Bacteroidales bacterium]|nr:histidine kinase [Bacteroidales bacterium]
MLCQINYATGSTNRNKYLANDIGPLNAEVFITSDENLDIEKIIDPAFQTKFAPIQEGQLTSPDKIYWYKLDFANYDLSVPDIWQLGFQNYDEIKIYYQEDDKNSAQIREKILYKRSDEFHFADNFLFKDQQLIHGNLLYARVKQTSKTLLLSDVVCRNAYMAYNNKAYYSSTELHLEIFYYIFIGGMALMIFYFLGIFFMYKDKLFLLYVLYMLSLLLYLGFKASYFHWELIKFIPGFHAIFHDLIQVLVNIFYLLFASVFLKARTDFPKLFVAIRYMVRILIGIMVIQLLVMLSPRFEHFDLYIINFERYFVIAFSLVAYFHIIKNYKDPMVLFLLIGSFFYLAGGLSAMIFKEVGFMMLGSAIEVFVFSLGMGYRVKKIEEEKKSIENEIVKVQLTALKAQMNPHFIFNSLNSIRAYVIASEVKKASGYLTKFAKLIRLILYYSSKDFITLKEELDALALYVELEQLRFRDDFGFEQKITPGVDLKNWLVPPLILQPYFENAIIHGLAPKQGEKKLEFEITFSDSRLIFTIKDNGVGRNYSGKNQHSKNKEHKSMSMELTKRRIDLSEESNSETENITITDLKDGDKPLGTKVVINLPVKQLSVI